MTPLNGTRTHPLSAHAIDVLRTLARTPRPRQEINPGVVSRFEREALVEIVGLPSPYRTHHGRPIDHLRLTDAGRDTLAKLGGTHG